MENLKLIVGEYNKFILKLDIYKLISASLKNEIWKFCEEGLFWFPCAEFVKVSPFFDCLQPKPEAVGIAYSMLVCSKLRWEYYDCMPEVSVFWSDYYDFLRDYMVKNFSLREQGLIFFFLEEKSSV